MLLLNTCCFCIPLRKGCLIIGYTLLFVNMLAFFIYCQKFLDLRIMSTYNLGDRSELYILQVITFLLLMFHAAQQMLALSLIQGIRKNIQNRVRVFMAGATVIYAIYVIAFCITVVRFASSFTKIDWILVSIEPVCGCVYVYFILVVRNYYHKMGDPKSQTYNLLEV